MENMDNDAKKMLSALAFLIMLVGMLFILACETDNTPKPTYYHMVHRENPDGTIDEWEVHTEIKPSGPCVCWEHENGGWFCVSGPYLTITPVKVDPIIEAPSESEKE